MSANSAAKAAARIRTRAAAAREDQELEMLRQTSLTRSVSDPQSQISGTEMEFRNASAISRATPTRQPPPPPVEAGTFGLTPRSQHRAESESESEEDVSTISSHKYISHAVATYTVAPRDAPPLLKKDELENPSKLASWLKEARHYVNLCAERGLRVYVQTYIDATVLDSLVALDLAGSDYEKKSDEERQRILIECLEIYLRGGSKTARNDTDYEMVHTEVKRVFTALDKSWSQKGEIHLFAYFRNFATNLFVILDKYQVEVRLYKEKSERSKHLVKVFLESLQWKQWRANLKKVINSEPEFSYNFISFINHMANEASRSQAWTIIYEDCRLIASLTPNNHQRDGGDSKPKSNGEKRDGKNRHRGNKDGHGNQTQSTDALRLTRQNSTDSKVANPSGNAQRQDPNSRRYEPPKIKIVDEKDKSRFRKAGVQSVTVDQSDASKDAGKDLLPIPGVPGDNRDSEANSVDVHDISVDPVPTSLKMEIDIAHPHADSPLPRLKYPVVLDTGAAVTVVGDAFLKNLEGCFGKPIGSFDFETPLLVSSFSSSQGKTRVRTGVQFAVKHLVLGEDVLVDAIYVPDAPQLLISYSDTLRIGVEIDTKGKAAIAPLKHIPLRPYVPFKDETGVALEEIEADEAYDSTIRLGDVNSVSLKELLSRNLDSSIPPGDVATAMTVALQAADIFAERLTSDEPMRVPPAVESFTVPLEQVRTYRRFTVDSEASEFLREHCKHLDAIGAIIKRSNAPCAVPSQAIRKPNGSFRHVLDCRPVNAVTKQIHLPEQILGTTLLRLRGSRYFATFDLTDGFWQVPYAPGQMFFWTNEGAWEMLRVPQGARNSTAHLRYALELVLGDLLGNGVEIYVDDILIHARDMKSFVTFLRRLFKRLREFHVYLKASKSTLIAREINWCGHIINEFGFRRDPRNLPLVREIDVPKTAADLQRILGLFSWMRDNIPNYAQVAQPLSELLNEASRGLASKKKTKLAKVPLLGWNDAHSDAFRGLKDSVANLPLLYHPVPEKVFHLFADASHGAFGSILTQLNVGEEVTSHQHEPLAFRSGTFTASALNWATVDKEAYAILDALRANQHILCVTRHPIQIHTDHRNLAFLLKPNAAPSDITVPRKSRLERWALMMQQFNYEIAYLPGELNGWADLFSRSLATPRMPKEQVDPEIGVFAVTLEENVPHGSLDSIMAEIRKASLQVSVPPVPDAVFDESRGFWVTDEHVFVPSEGSLRSKLIHLAHSEFHTGSESLYLRLSKDYFWEGMRKDIENVCSSCLDCMVSANYTVRNPLGAPLHATAPDQILHFDYLSLPENIYGYSALLLFKDDFTGMIELYPTDSQDADHVAKSMAEWLSRHDVPKIWISDRGTHFKNQVMDSLAKILGVRHHFVAPYSPWANGTVEVVNRDISKIFRTLLSSRRLHEENWLEVLDLVVAAVNKTPTRHRGGHSPLELYTGRAPTTIAQSVLNPFTGLRERPLDNKEIQEYLEDLCNHLADVHAGAAETMESRRLAERARTSGKLQKTEFKKDDLVLVQQKDTANKLQSRWIGPARVVDVRDDGFVCDLIFDGDTQNSGTYHIHFLRKFDPVLKPQPGEVESLIRHHSSSRREYSDVLDIAKKDKRWKAYLIPATGTTEDALWLPIKEAKVHLPEKLQAFLSRPDLPDHIKNSLQAIRLALR